MAFNGEFTISYWTKIQESNTSIPDLTMINKRYDKYMWLGYFIKVPLQYRAICGADPFWDFRKDTAGGIYFEYYYNSTYYWSITTPIPSSGWHHIFLTLKLNSFFLYDNA